MPREQGVNLNMQCPYSQEVGWVGFGCSMDYGYNRYDRLKGLFIESTLERKREDIDMIR